MRVIAAPITSNVTHIYPFEAKMILKDRECKVLIDQIRALDRQRLGQKIISIDSETMLRVEEALTIVLGLKKE